MHYRSNEWNDFETCWGRRQRRQPSDKNLESRAQDAILTQFCSILRVILAHLDIPDRQDGHLDSRLAVQNAQHSTNMNQDEPTSS